MMSGTEVTNRTSRPDVVDRTATSQSFDWYAEGETRTVDVDGIQVTVKFVGRKGRRARIAITAPAGTIFAGANREKTD